jgi:DNA polymerase elongation subunit (family B)
VVKLPDQKILVLDIEWRPTKAYVWGPFKQFISDGAVLEDGGLLCVGAMWLHDKKVHVFSEWEHGHVEMIKKTYKMMEEADVIVGFNSDKFDIPKLMGEGLLHGIPPVAPTTSIDLYKAIKKFGFFRNSLGFIAPFLGIGKKMEHEGMALWIKVINGDEKAQRRMGRYCGQDVRLTGRLYLKIRPYIRNHPYLGKAGAAECPSCGGKHSHSRGSVRTRFFQKQRLQCQDCGHWYHGRQTKL